MGVKYTVDDTRSPREIGVAYAKREIILSSGAYGSAMLLMRSGIGPKSVLKRSGIPVLKELPVGENLQEHPVVPMHFVLNNRSLSYDPVSELTPENYEMYNTYGTGPYSSVAGYAGQAFVASSVARRNGEHNWPDTHLCLTAYTARLEPFQNIRMEHWETSVIMNLYIGREKSRGTVKLDPKNPNNPPIIDFNYLSDITDEEIWLDGIVTKH